MNWLLFGIVLFTLGGAGVVVLWFFRRAKPADDPANWSTTEGTIQSVERVAVNSGRTYYMIDVGDFSYVVNDEYYSGRATISRSSFSDGGTPADLVNKRFQVRYNRQQPDKFDLSMSDVAGFVLERYNDIGTDVDPIDLNLNKI